MEILKLNDSDFRSDPYGAFRRAREAGPFCKLVPNDLLGVTRYADVVAVLKNPALFSSAKMEDAFPPIKGAELFSQTSVLLGTDPPAHARLRRLVQRAFTLQEMAAWEPKIDALAKGLVENIAQRSSFDFIGDLAMPLPVLVIAEMLGIDPNRRHDFKRWSDDMVSVQAILHSSDQDWRQRREREVVQSCQEFKEYFEGVIAERRKDKTGRDLISAMTRASEDDDILRPEEVLALTRLMLVAGNETTTNLLGNAMTALLTHPEQWQLLVEDPSLAALAMEEALRFDGPVLHMARRVTRDTELAGREIPQGTFVAAMMASANRDPQKFADPDRFDMRRNARDHLAFGLGIHLCVGAPLARIETTLVLRYMATMLSDVKLADARQADRNEALFLRGHKSLPMLRESSRSRHSPAVPSSREAVAL